MKHLAALAYAPMFFGCIVWASKSYALTRGPAGVLAGFIILLPAILCAGTAAAILNERIRPWGWMTRLLFVFYAAASLLIIILRPDLKREYGVRQEAKTRSELASVRVSIAAWTKDRGSFPGRPSKLVPHYLEILPLLSLPGTGHPITREVEFPGARTGVDTGRWLYVDNPKNPFYGKVRINCTHTDSAGFRWSGY